MFPTFKNRQQAGQKLAEKLTDYKERDDVVVLGLPRGGIPVGFEIAQGLNVTLDIYIVRKLGTPGQEELAMGAIASDGARVLNESVINAMSIPEDVIERKAEAELEEIQRREQAYRGDRQRTELKGKIVILTDDGLATGASMKAAIRAVNESEPKELIVAVGTTPQDTYAELEAWDEVTKIVAGVIPERFYGVGGSYQDFDQTTDAEVNACLKKAWTL